MVDGDAIRGEATCITGEDVNYSRNRKGRNSGYRRYCGGNIGNDNRERGNSDKWKGTKSTNLSILMHLIANLSGALVAIQLDI